MTGSCSIWLLSEAAYEQLNMKNTLAVPLSELFSEKPSAAYDDYAVRLGDTELYDCYPALQVLPADTLVVLSGRVKLFGGTSEKDYEKIKDVFRAIVEFQAPTTEG